MAKLQTMRLTGPALQGHGLGGMGDPNSADPLYQAIIPSIGPGNPGGFVPGGPVIAPIVPPFNPETPPNVELVRLLGDLPLSLLRAIRTQLIAEPREIVPFVLGGASTSVAASSSIITFTVPQNYVGFLKKIGLATIAQGGAPDITWSLLINNAVHPYFSNLGFYASYLNPMLDFPMEITSGKRLILRATNTNAGGPLDVTGILAGWLERMSDSKPYGQSPASGIG